MPDTELAEVLDGSRKWTLLRGPSEERLRELPDMSVDACVTDPPAGIEFMGREWDSFKTGRLASYAKPPGGTCGPKTGEEWLEQLPGFNQKANRKCRDCGRYAWTQNPCRCGTGNWEADTGARDTFVAAMVAVFSEVWRVLKPGGHALVWTIPRTSHWTAWALEEAGFEVRDVVTHHFGSGFPKSLDVAKAIDKMKGNREQILQVTRWIASARDRAGVTNREIDAHMGFAGMAGHWTTQESQPQVPTPDQWPRLLAFLRVEELPEPIRGLVESITSERGKPGPNWYKREVTGAHDAPAAAATWRANMEGETPPEPGERRDLPATPEAARWQGWGSALKPATEHWILVRRPLPASIARTVLAHGTGALNIDGCRVPVTGETLQGYGEKGSDPANRQGVVGKALDPSGGDAVKMAEAQRASIDRTNTLGRFPPNLLLTHSAGCRPAGTREAKVGFAGKGSGWRKDGYVGGSAEEATLQDAWGSYGEGGREEVPASECEPGCPVAARDEQSGESACPETVGRGMTRSEDASVGFFRGDRPVEQVEGYGDSGAASRFFPRFDCEDGCPIAELDSQAPEAGGGIVEPYERASRDYYSGDWPAVAHGGGHDEGGGPASRFFPRFDCEADCPVAEVDEQSGEVPSGTRHAEPRDMGYHGGSDASAGTPSEQIDEGGGASRYYPRFPGGLDAADTGELPRFLYQPKASRAERNAGLDHLPDQRKAQLAEGELDDVSARYVSHMANTHPTVKAINLMRWLIRLVTPPGGVVLDPFTGSGSTGVAAMAEDLRFIGCEKTDEYWPIIEGRMAWAESRGPRPQGEVLGTAGSSGGKTVKVEEVKQNEGGVLRLLEGLGE